MIMIDNAAPRVGIVSELSYGKVKASCAPSRRRAGNRPASMQLVIDLQACE